MTVKFETTLLVAVDRLRPRQHVALVIHIVDVILLRLLFRGGAQVALPRRVNSAHFRNRLLFFRASRSADKSLEVAENDHHNCDIVERLPIKTVFEDAFNTKTAVLMD